MEYLKVSMGNLVVNVKPLKADAIVKAIKSEMGNLLFKFNEVFDGVLLAYELVKISGDGTKILSGLHPYIRVNFRAKLLFFSPKPNMYLEGKVVQVTEESIYVVVLGFVGAIINKEDIRDEFRYKIRNEEETFRSKSNKRHVIKAGTTILFLVTSFDEEVLHMSGSLVPVCTGNIQYIDQSFMEECFTSGRISKSSKRSRTESGELLTEGAAASAAPSNLSKRGKAKRLMEYPS